MVNILYQSWEAYTKAVRYLCRYTFSRLKFFLSASHPPAHAFKSNCYNTLTTLHSPCVTTSPYRKPFTPYRSTKRPPAPKSTSENVKDAGLDRLNTVLINFLISTGTTPIFLKKSWGHFFGSVDCTHLNIDWQLQSLRNTITAWKHHKLSFKGKARRA